MDKMEKKLNRLVGKVVKDISHSTSDCIINFTDGSSIGFMAGYEEPLEINLEDKNGKVMQIQSGTWD